MERKRLKGTLHLMNMSVTDEPFEECLMQYGLQYLSSRTYSQLVIMNRQLMNVSIWDLTVGKGVHLPNHLENGQKEHQLPEIPHTFQVVPVTLSHFTQNHILWKRTLVILSEVYTKTYTQVILDKIWIKSLRELQLPTNLRFIYLNTEDRVKFEISPKGAYEIKGKKYFIKFK